MDRGAIKVRRRQSCIYALLCPETGAVRYVGQTKNAYRRRWMHSTPSNNLSNRSVHVWARSLFNKGKHPNFTVLEETNDLDAREVYWILHYQELRADLLNMTKGGRDVSHFTKAVRSPANIGQTPLHKFKQRVANRANVLRRYGLVDAADRCVDALHVLEVTTKLLTRRLGGRAAANARLNDVYLAVKER